MQEKQHAGPVVLGHPDKVELSLTNSAGNSLLLPKSFPLLVLLWTTKFGFRWSSRLAGSNWQVSGFSQGLRATFSGWARDIGDNEAWRENPFAGAHFRQLYGTSRRGSVAALRFTTPNKTDPAGYLSLLVSALGDLELFGVQEQPSLLEIALDSYGENDLRNTVRLSRDKPADFHHWRDGTYHAGGSRDGRHTEYSGRNAFLGDRKQGRELCCYRKGDFYRVELRLGKKPLLRFRGSPAYEKAAESAATPLLLRDYVPVAYSPSLDLLGLLPQLAAAHLQFETMDLERIRSAYPASAYWRLKNQTTRQVRFLLARHGLNPGQMSRYASKVPPPPVRWLFPTAP